ncbi:MAG: hypothetical protein MK105_05635 [Crocinitomicaceae bacterium]|nr:hypothetical protein [Crocinitomicaceae bacterium]
MKCKKCNTDSVKIGIVKSTGIQRYYCNNCKRSYIESYSRKSYEYDINIRIIALLKEGCGTRSISRLLEIAPETVTTRIKLIAKKISKPIIYKGRIYEMDEMYTYIGNKSQRYCIAYAIDRKTR